jgi:hypothetical protein
MRVNCNLGAVKAEKGRIRQDPVQHRISIRSYPPISRMALSFLGSSGDQLMPPSLKILSSDFYNFYDSVPTWLT